MMNAASSSTRPHPLWRSLLLRFGVSIFATFLLGLLAYGPLSYYSASAIITDDDYRLHNSVARAYRPVFDHIAGTALEKPWFAYRQWWVNRAMTDTHLYYCKLLPAFEVDPYGNPIELMWPPGMVPERPESPQPDIH